MGVASGAIEHRNRVVAAMDAAEVDVLLLGRESNGRYVSGADRLWLAGTRPFAPGCVFVRSTGAVHVLSITDDGLPPDVTPDRLFPISWNPMAILERVAAIDGVAGAARVGVDGMTPLFDQLIGVVLAGAELVDAESLLRDVRRQKTPSDIDAIRAATETAERALVAVSAELRAGIAEIELAGIYEEAMTDDGVTAPAFEGTFCVVEPDASRRTFPSDRVVTDGDHVHVRAGVMRDGWEGLVARTLVCGGTPVRSPGLTDAVARCCAATLVGAVRAAPATVDGTGMGHEELADDDKLTDDMVVRVEVLVDGVLDGATVHVTRGGPEALSAR